MEIENTNTQEIIFDQVINKINHLGKESDKNDFILNFNQVKTQIVTIDKVLELDNDLDPNTPIDKLFEMLELYSGVLDNKDEKIVSKSCIYGLFRRPKQNLKNSVRNKA